jgi:hypothetical protein
VARYQRSGHWRRGRNGTVHWVSSHVVNRGSWSGSRRLGLFSAATTEWQPRVRTRTAPTHATESWTVHPDRPNARCPICFEPVWFFRNKRGGCAYFDAIGKPWPLHPCMEQSQSAKDYQAVLEAPFAYERAKRERPRAAARQGLSGTDRDSAVRMDATVPGTYFASAPPAKRASSNEPLDWRLVLSGLWALLLSFPVSRWVDAKLDWIPTLLSLWAISLPTLCMALSIGWFLLRAPRPRFEPGDVIVSFVMAPILLLLGVFGNLLTCGLAVPAAALYVASEGNDAHRRERIRKASLQRRDTRSNGE